jgi:hypothetical protein
LIVPVLFQSTLLTNPLPRGSPWQNSFAERLIGTIRRECVDHIAVMGEAHLRRTLRSFDQDAPSADRTHRVARPGWRAASPIHPDLGFRHAQGKLRVYQSGGLGSVSALKTAFL